MTVKKIPATSRAVLFKIMGRYKRGERASREDSDFCTKMRDKYPDDYSKIDREVFEATRPFGTW